MVTLSAYTINTINIRGLSGDNIMTPAEKRKFIRLDALHLLEYYVIDEKGNECEYAMARTLDVSINGIKMETLQEIPLNATLIITLGIEDNLIDISGTPVHSELVDNRYLSGIEFDKVEAQDREILRRYVDEFQSRKATLLNKDDFPKDS